MGIKNDSFKFKLDAGIVISLILFLTTLVRALVEKDWPIDHDCAMYYYFGQMLLGGKVPYLDFVDLNPPLIFYVSIIPAAIGRYAGVSAQTAHAIFTWVLSMGSWLGAYFLIAAMRKRAQDKPFENYLLGAAVVSYATREWSQYGQRDHLFALAMVPYFCLRYMRYSSSAKSPAALSLILGLVMGIAILIKPHYVLIPLALEVFWLVKTRAIKQIKQWIVVEHLGMICAGVIYLVIFMLIPEAARHEFFDHLVPLIARGYSAFDRERSSLILIPLLTGCLPLLLWASFLTWIFKAKNELRVPLWVWSLSAYASFLLQSKGWFNHLMPMMTGCTLLLATEINCLIKHIGEGQTASGFKSMLERACRSFGSGKIAVVTIMFCMALLLPWVVFRQVYLFKYKFQDLAIIEKETLPGDAVTVYSSALSDAFPLIVLSNRTYGSRYAFLFPLPMVDWVRKQSKGAADEAYADKVEQKVVADLKQDLAHYHPKLIFIEKNIVGRLTTLNFIQSELSDYQNIGICDSLPMNKMTILKKR